MFINLFIFRNFLGLSSILLYFISFACASIPSRTSLYNEDTTRPFLEPINGTKNFRMHGKKSKDDSKWVWDGRDTRYIYCVRQSTSKCEDLQYTETCFGQNLPYQSTSNDLTNYLSQGYSLEQLHSYQQLRHIPKCWSAIQPFLCAVFFPKCEKINGVDMIYLPSYEMCKITMEPCKILYNSTFFPDFLKCNESIFPSKCNNDVRELKFNLTGQCIKPLVDTEDPANFYKDIDGCGIGCDDPYYTEEEHRQVRKLIAWGASICLVLHLFAIFTFTIDWHNGNKYPALIIFYVNLCYMISCLGWLGQFLPGARKDIVCRFDKTLKTGEPNGGENLSCIIVFIFVYYFLMAAMCWFVIFTYAWHVSFKAIGKIQERIDKKASYFHLIAWSIPLVLTIAIMAISEVDGNSITGICFVGYVNHAIRGGFVLGPLICSLLIGGYFLARGMAILINLKISSKQIISTRASKKIRQSIIRMGICSVLTFVFICITISCHIYEFKNSSQWAESLRNYIICKITTTYEEVESCKNHYRPSVSILQLHLMSLFASGVVMASFVFTPSTLEIWSRYYKRKLGPRVDEPLKLQKHKVIAQAFAKRKEFQNRGRLSISFHNSHTDPVGLKFDMNSAIGSQDFSSTWANNLPRFVNRRYALTGCPSSSTTSHGHRRNSIDSISFSVRQVSVESRRNSNDSQISVKIAEMKTKVASRSRGSKSKSRSSRHHRRDFTSRRYSRKESSTSIESQIVAMKAASSQKMSSTSTAEVGNMIVPMRHSGSRRSGLTAMDPQQINELIAKNKCLLPFLTTSDDDKSSAASFNMQESKLDVILKQIGLSEHRIIENKMSSDNNKIIDMELLEMDKTKITDEDSSGKENFSNGGRISKNSNRSIGSRKSLNLKTSSTRLKKSRKSSRSITKSTNPLANSGRRKSDRNRDKMRSSHGESFGSMAINIHGSYSGRSDVGIQTENPSEMSSNEFAERLIKQDQLEAEDDEHTIETSRLLAKRTSVGASSKRRSTNENLLSESEKLKLLLLPSN